MASKEASFSSKHLEDTVEISIDEGCIDENTYRTNSVITEALRHGGLFQYVKKLKQPRSLQVQEGYKNLCNNTYGDNLNCAVQQQCNTRLVSDDLLPQDSDCSALDISCNKQPPNSPGSVVLPDVVSNSTSTCDSSSYSVVEDISNRHESSLRSDSLTEPPAGIEVPLYKEDNVFGADRSQEPERKTQAWWKASAASSQDLVGCSPILISSDDHQLPRPERIFALSSQSGTATDKMLQEADSAVHNRPNHANDLSANDSSDGSIELEADVLDQHDQHDNFLWMMFPRGIKVITNGAEKTLEKQPNVCPTIDTDITTTNTEYDDYMISNATFLETSTESDNPDALFGENPHDEFCRKLMKQWPSCSVEDTSESLISSQPPHSLIPSFSKFPIGSSYEDIETDGVQISESPQVLLSEEEMCLRRLQSAKQCDDKLCTDEDCKLGKVMMQALKLSLGSGDLKQHDHWILCTIQKHSTVCSEMCCSVPWCSDFQEIDDDNVEEAVDKFRKEHFHEYGYTDTTLRLSKEDIEFTSIDDDQGYGSMSDNDLELDILGHLGSSENVVLAQDKRQRLKLLAIKKSRSCSETKSIIVALREAKLYHQKYLVTHLWAAELHFRRNIYMAAQFEGGNDGTEMNLRNFLLKRRHSRQDYTGSSPSELQRWILAAMKAMDFLHKCKILYLNWRAENFLVSVNPKDPTCYYLKLCNFSSAVTKSNVERNQELAEDLSQKLPPHLVPPEFITDPDEALILFPQSDFWPFGCIVYELVAGDPLHWELRHLPVDEQRIKIKTSMHIQPTTPSLKNGIKTLLSQCFKINPVERKPDFNVLKTWS